MSAKHSELTSSSFAELNEIDDAASIMFLSPING